MGRFARTLTCIAAALALLTRAPRSLALPLSIEPAVASLGSGEAEGARSVKWGPGAREAVTIAARHARQEGRATITIERIALAAIEADPVSPMFYDALGCTRRELREALGGDSSD